MALLDMFQLTVNGTYLGQVWHNVFHAERANAGETAQFVNNAFANSILPVMRAFAIDSVIFTDAVTFNLDDPTDFHTQTYGSAPGFRVGLSPASTFLAAGVRFPSTTRLIRSGQKRFIGLDEDDLASGVLDGAAEALVEDVADALLADWLSPIDSHVVANYAVVKRVCRTPAEDPCTSGYRLPETDGELAFYLPVSRVVRKESTSQVSRKKSGS